MAKDSPYLVQRMRYEERPSHEGIDAFFVYDYMGSSEFEWGALPATLKALRAKMTEDWSPQEFKYKDKYTAWYVGPPELQGWAWEWWVERLEDKFGKHRMKEHPYLYESFVAPEEKDNKTYFIRDGWMCVDTGSEFGLFRTKMFAEKFLHGLRNPPPKAT